MMKALKTLFCIGGWLILAFWLSFILIHHNITEGHNNRLRLANMQDKPLTDVTIHFGRNTLNVSTIAAFSVFEVNQPSGPEGSVGFEAIFAGTTIRCRTGYITAGFSSSAFFQVKNKGQVSSSFGPNWLPQPAPTRQQCP